MRAETTHLSAGRVTLLPPSFCLRSAASGTFTHAEIMVGLRLDERQALMQYSVILPCIG